MRTCIANKFRKISFQVKMAGIKDHAERELTSAGLFDEDSDYGGLLGHSVLELCALFGSQGHSGCSAELTLDLFDKLARFKTLTPITSDPSEWDNVTNYAPEGPPMWQNKRDCSFFSNDAGKTWWGVDEKVGK